jgi:hypothetical protein
MQSGGSSTRKMIVPAATSLASPGKSRDLIVRMKLFGAIVVQSVTRGREFARGVCADLDEVPSLQ